MIPKPDDIAETKALAPAPAPVVSWGILILCVAVYGWQSTLPGSTWGDAILNLGFTPANLMSPQIEPNRVPTTVSMVTFMFLHGSLLHLLGNLLYLAVFGGAIETAMGHVRFLLFYLVCGVVAALTMAFMDPSSVGPMVGASAPLSGVLAAFMLLYPRAQVTLKIPVGLVLYRLTVNPIWLVGLWFAAQLLALTWPATSGIAWWAHVGGFAAGLALTPFLKAASVPLFGPRDGAETGTG